MKFSVNGRSVKLNGTVSVLDLLALQKVRIPEQVCVSINDKLLLRSDYETTCLKENDRVELRDSVWGM